MYNHEDTYNEGSSIRNAQTWALCVHSEVGAGGGVFVTGLQLHRLGWLGTNGVVQWNNVADSAGLFTKALVLPGSEGKVCRRKNMCLMK